MLLKIILILIAFILNSVIMKNLELNQMETLEGGLSNRDCMVRGTFAVLLAFTPLFAVSIGIVATSADCFTN